MPYLLPCGDTNGHQLSREMRTSSLGSVVVHGRSSPLEEILKSSRSNSLEGLKRKVLLKKRSCSAENKLKGDSLTLDTEEKSTNLKLQKNSLFSKLSLRTKEKSYSTDEISPPSSVPSSPPSNAKSYENIHRLPFHHSADCLKQEEFVSEEDLAGNEALLRIKRSCSVPCKPRDQCRAESLDGSPRVNLTDKQYLISEHFLDVSDSDPGEEISRNQLIARLGVFEDVEGVKTNNTEDRPSNHVCPKLEPNKLDAVRNTGSTSSSDVSDYIETLSLCSRTSSGSGSSNDYVRPEDLLHHQNNQCLRPRYGREYHSLDRNVTHEEDQHRRDVLSKDIRNNLNSFVAAKPVPTKSGSPGYAGSTPVTVDCHCSPSAFHFPKRAKDPSSDGNIQRRWEGDQLSCG